MTFDCSDSGAWALALVLHIHGIGADPARIQQETGKTRDFDEIDILRAARNYPVRTKAISYTSESLRRIPTPALVGLKGGGFAVIGKVSEHGVLLQRRTEASPQLISLVEFEAETTGRLIILGKRETGPKLAQSFDLSWFINAARRYKRIFGEVLLASFVLQLFALTTPLIFQTVIDKVLVHRGYSTLEVMAAGLALIALFDALLSGLRNYLFAHTSNRIDVELGARVFQHLLRLPLAYFEARRVGDSVARIRELETIRQFITSSTMTAVLDLAFCVVFLAVMFIYSTALTWIVVGALPLFAILSLATTPIFRQKLDEKFRRGAENQAFLVESITGIETIKAMAVEPQIQLRWEEQLAAYVSASFVSVAS